MTTHEDKEIKRFDMSIIDHSKIRVRAFSGQRIKSIIMAKTNCGGRTPCVVVLVKN